jgi:hypothetical protein
VSAGCVGPTQDVQTGDERAPLSSASKPVVLLFRDAFPAQTEHHGIPLIRIRIGLLGAAAENCGQSSVVVCPSRYILVVQQLASSRQHACEEL